MHIQSLARTLRAPAASLTKRAPRAAAGRGAGGGGRAGGAALARAAHSDGAALARTSHTPPRAPEQAPPPPPPPPPGGAVSDHEWNLRAGRAVHTLRTTLPAFFETGLVARAGPAAEPIYAPHIRLRYAPRAGRRLPPPFPRTLQVEGLPLYHAAAAFVRHTLAALHTELGVELRKLHVRARGARRREIVLRTGVAGRSRLSGARNEWDVTSTYTLSPQSGLIEAHVVESIQPAPHVAVFDGLRAALARLAGVPAPVPRAADPLARVRLRGAVARAGRGCD